MPGLYRSDFGNARHVNALAKRHRPYCLSRPRAGPSSLALGVKRAPLRIRGDGAPGGAAVIVKDPHLLAKMRKRLPARHPNIVQCPGSFAAVWFRFDTIVKRNCGAGPRFARALAPAFGKKHAPHRQPAPGGRLVLAAGRSPGTARVLGRSVRLPPAGAASGSITRRLMMTPLD